MAGRGRGGRGWRGRGRGGAGGPQRLTDEDGQQLLDLAEGGPPKLFPVSRRPRGGGRRRQRRPPPPRARGAPPAAAGARRCRRRTPARTHAPTRLDARLWAAVSAPPGRRAATAAGAGGQGRHPAAPPPVRVAMGRRQAGRRRGPAPPHPALPLNPPHYPFPFPPPRELRNSFQSGPYFMRRPTDRQRDFEGEGPRCDLGTGDEVTRGACSSREGCACQPANGAPEPSLLAPAAAAAAAAEEQRRMRRRRATGAPRWRRWSSTRATFPKSYTARRTSGEPGGGQGRSCLWGF
jgi:hypothetical protein